MDLLGSILSSMEKPPSVGEKEKKLAQERKNQIEKMKLEDRKRKNEFRAKVEKEVDAFLNDSARTRLKYPPIDKVYRSIIHDVAEVAGMTSFSFGEAEVDRYIMLFKKEIPPTEEELNAYKRGEKWDPEEARFLAKKVAEEAEKARQVEEAREPVKVVPTSDYKAKYKDLIGEESAKDAARHLTPNKQFGFVPSENKRDKRSVEETLDAIRAKKQKKYDDGIHQVPSNIVAELCSTSNTEIIVEVPSASQIEAKTESSSSSKTEDQ
ncbi:sperm-associated antigen 7-like [Strongylocentrotus purpuratus]|uniref:R3H domain-containing protein n=1 Tax=Strongylocentrotus purpuratus TaxID=7668 RepID=A0A7M7NY47_STRPU|nr:sperm-associated antigen 7 [Strongylocentrotus purpuratus]XP_030842693.1 sperm-associated antigen 7-like [Strongylocentrotus purpuratus]